jgi:hypothetical protein
MGSRARGSLFTFSGGKRTIMSTTSNDEADTASVTCIDETNALTAFNNGRIDVVTTRGIEPRSHAYLSLTVDSSSSPARISLPQDACCICNSSARQVAFVSLYDRTLRVYGMSSTLSLTRTFELKTCITSMAVTQDNKLLIAGDLQGINWMLVSPISSYLLGFGSDLNFETLVYPRITFMIYFFLPHAL